MEPCSSNRFRIFSIRSLPKRRLFSGPQHLPLQVVSLRRHGHQFRLQVLGCNDREAAEAYRGQEIQVRLDDAPDLPPGRYYHWQILGLRVLAEAGESVGVIRQILETGANDVYVLETESGGELLLPAITSVVRGVDLEAGVMTVRLIPGLAETTRRKTRSVTVSWTVSVVSG